MIEREKMGKCVNHPDRETSYMCSKHGIYLCEECLECRDPDIYCKFRSACPIWYEHKRKARKARQEAALKKADTYKVTFESENKTVQVTPGSTLLEAPKKRMCTSTPPATAKALAAKAN
jgi:hypothetical protein